MKYFRPIFILALLFLLSSRVTLAVTEPTFPLCSNPQGSVKASYGSGTHGVPGLSQTFTGSDQVYIISDDTLTQCLCVDGGEGIQTNWWKATSLNQQEIDQLLGLGWLYVPDGANWGLDSAPYLAINSAYSCRGPLGGIGGDGIGGVQTPSLAGTGDNFWLYATGVLALVFIVIGLNRNKNV